MQKTIKITKKQEEAMRRDFKNFLFVVFQMLGLPSPTPLQYSIADYLQHGPSRLIVVAFRGVGKSLITVAFVAWKFWNNKELKIMIVSAGEDRATSFAIFLKQILHFPFLSHLLPHKGQRDSQNVFDIGGCSISGDPSVKSVGITSQLTGSRADVIIADDIEIPNNSGTHVQREKLKERVTEFEAVKKTESRVIYLGTPQTEQSLYNHLATGLYQMNIWPVRILSEDEVPKYNGRLNKFVLDAMINGVPGHSIEPRFTNEDLFEREVGYGKSGFALQFMLDTTLSDANRYPLKIDDLIVTGVDSEKGPTSIYWDNSPLNKINTITNVAIGGQNFYSPKQTLTEYLPFQGSVLVIDPSGRGGDETAYAVGKLLNGNIFLQEVSGFVGGYTDEVLVGLCEVAKKHKVNHVLIESNFGDGMFAQLIHPHMAKIYPCHIEEVRNSKQKELRIIDTLEPVLNQHRLVIDPGVIEYDYKSAVANCVDKPESANHYMFIYQMTRISKDKGSLKNDDRLDAVAMMVQYFNIQLGVDQETQAKKQKQDELSNMLKNFVKNHSMNTNRPNNQSVHRGRIGDRRGR